MSFDTPFIIKSLEKCGENGFSLLCLMRALIDTVRYIEQVDDTNETMNSDKVVVRLSSGVFKLLTSNHLTVVVTSSGTNSQVFRKPLPQPNPDSFRGK